jgi:hypothetical protein
MTTIENSSANVQPPMTDEQIDFETKRKKAQEMMKRLKVKIQKNTPWMAKPELGEYKKLFFDIEKVKEETAPDAYRKPTKENPNPTRDVVAFTVRTEEGDEKPFQLTPNEAMEVYKILDRKGGSSWIEVGRESTTKGGTKLTFLAL